MESHYRSARSRLRDILTAEAHGPVVVARNRIRVCYAYRAGVTLTGARAFTINQVRDLNIRAIHPGKLHLTIRRECGTGHRERGEEQAREHDRDYEA